MTETATATNPNEASASSEASATLLATAGGGTGTQQQTQTVEGQTPQATGTQAEGSTTAAGAAAPVAPEKYTFTAPEGTEYDPEVLESFSGAAKEAGLSQDAAQKLIEKMAPALVARQVDQIEAIRKEWGETSAADPEIGGTKLQENLGVIKGALKNFPAGEKLNVLLEETGLGNHPDVLRYLLQVGKAISEDKFVAGTPRGAAKSDVTSVLYDKTAKG